MDWLASIMVDPFDYPQGWFGYLALPTLTSALLAWWRPEWSKLVIVFVCVVGSIVLYFGLYIVLYGVSSTISIGIMFALVIYSVVCVATVGLTRVVRRALATAS